MEVQVNYWGVVLAAVSTMVVGAIWYAKPVFGTVWARLARVDEKKAEGRMVKTLSLTFLLSLLTAYILAHLSYLAHDFFGNSFFEDAVTTAFWVWLGLVMTRLVTHALFEQRPARLSVLAVGNEFVTIMIMGVIIGLFAPSVPVLPPQ